MSIITGLDRLFEARRLVGCELDLERRRQEGEKLKIKCETKMAKAIELKTGAKKDLSGKLRFDLIPPEVDRSLAETYTLGAEKYEDRNWEKGIPFSIILGSLKRHLNQFELGEMINTADGNLLHADHVLWWAAALVTFLKRGREDLNDLDTYKKI